MSDTAKYEEALQKLFAGWTSRTANENIFIGAVPEGMLETTAVIVDAEITQEDTDRLEKFYGRYIGKTEDRDAARAEIDLIKNNLIKYSEEITVDSAIVKLHQIRQRGGEALYETKDEGKDVWNFVLNLILEFNPA